MRKEHEVSLSQHVSGPFRGSDGTKSAARWGVLSSILYVIGIDVVAALRYPDDHNSANQMVSELFAVGAPTRTLMVWLSIPYNFLVFTLAAGVWASAGDDRATRLTAAALVGNGALSIAGLFLFPMDVRGTVGSQRDALHIVATIAMSIFIVAVMAFGAFVHGTPEPTPWVGLAERVNIYATMLWLAVLAVCFLRVQ